MNLSRLCFAAPLLFALTCALSACDFAPKPKSSMPLAECRLKDFDSAARCAMFSVPEDHNNAKNGKTLNIHVAVIPSLARRAEPDPIYFFAGGPGQAASDLGRIVGALGELRKHRDVVLVDQRGTGKSKTLSCEANTEPKADPLIQALSALDADIERDRLRCLATLKGNPAVHRTDDYIDDVEAVRKALGHSKINVWGGSYGSRVGLRYMKRFPDSIRSAVLDGVAPTTLHLPDDALQSSEAELRGLLASCTASTRCNKAYPDALALFDTLLAKLKAAPERAQVPHPSTGALVGATISDRTLVSLLWPLLYQPEAARLVPTLIAQAAAGNFAPLAATATASSAPSEELAGALRMAVLCAEDMLGRTAATTANPRFEAITQLFYAACKGFPHGKVAPEFFEPTASSIPTLLLSGKHDPVTPPSQAVLAAKTLSVHKHVVVAGMGHIVSPHPCVRRVIAKFIDDGALPAAADACEADLNGPLPLFYTSTLEATP
jgi:pimeloyl-ACP methyl ester carboxylesterase